MTPKEKAYELYDKFYMAIPSDEMGLCDEASRQCALIAVEEILNAITFNMYDEDAYNKEDKYWQEVKEEINNSRKEKNITKKNYVPIKYKNKYKNNCVY